MNEIDPSLKRTTVWRVTKLLESLAANSGRVGVREVAGTTGIDRSTANRLLSNLLRLKYVEQDDRSGHYVAGPRLFALAAALVTRDELAAAARPVLEELTDRFNESSYLATRGPTSFTYRARVDCTREIRHIINIGYEGTLHAGAAGRAILTGLTEEELAEVLDRIDFNRFTENTITSREELERKVRSDTAQGFTFASGERISGVTSVAAPFFDASNRCIGSIVMTRPADRHDENELDEIQAAVRQAAERLTVRLGGSTDPESLQSDTDEGRHLMARVSNERLDR